jgi:hypothetical protein
MAFITNQVKRTVKAMKRAGFKRSEFICRNDSNTYTHKGRRITEYGSAIVSPRIKTEEVIERIPAMLENGLDVTVMEMKSTGYKIILIKEGSGIWEEGAVGKYEEVDVEERARRAEEWEQKMIEKYGKEEWERMMEDD